MIASFKSKALRLYWTKNDASGLRPDWARKVARILLALDKSELAEDMNVTGYHFHALTGNMQGRYAVTVSRNWRITFAFTDGKAFDVDLEDYHG